MKTIPLTQWNKSIKLHRYVTIPADEVVDDVNIVSGRYK
jgi:hypothetical protein